MYVSDSLLPVLALRALPDHSQASAHCLLFNEQKECRKGLSVTCSLRNPVPRALHENNLDGSIMHLLRSR